MKKKISDWNKTINVPVNTYCPNCDRRVGGKKVKIRERGWGCIALAIVIMVLVGLSNMIQHAIHYSNWPGYFGIHFYLGLGGLLLGSLILGIGIFITIREHKNRRYIVNCPLCNTTIDATDRDMSDID